MARLLFITTKDVQNSSDGGGQCTNRNYLSFCEILGEKNVVVFNIRAEFKKAPNWRIEKRANYFLGFFEGLSKRIIQQICQKAASFDVVFIDESPYGAIAYYLKKNQYKGRIISFFHNVEYKLMQEQIRKNPLKSWKGLITRYNEKSAFRYSDERVVLNKRDVKALRKLYGPQPCHVIPISFIDVAGKLQNAPMDSPLTVLFVGSRWYANIHGISWFIKNVLDEVDIRLQVAGRGMDEIKEQFKHPKVDLLGFVPDLSVVIKAADLILAPIFLGSGMKVKTCEALMYGKNIIGTKEAFEGYELNYDKVGALCNTKEEFIRHMQSLCLHPGNKFNAYSRACFEERYSFEATLPHFRKLLAPKTVANSVL